MSEVFHAGERTIQAAAGVDDQARLVGRIIGSTVSDAAARFLDRQRVVVASSRDRTGRVWASLLTGPEGFIAAVDDQLVRIAAPPTTDPLWDNIRREGPLGLLIIDVSTRQRIRLNGRGSLMPNGLLLTVAQAYGNCPKYIQRRVAKPDGTPTRHRPIVSRRLSNTQTAWIGRADTLFLATLHPEAGADASHRGGQPGFVRVESATQISFPDYPGNAMFNSLGNLVVNPRAGLLFVDFEHGHLLQLTGTARLNAERRLTFDIDRSVETPRGSRLRFSFVEYSPSNPAAVCHTAPLTSI